jgi:anti-sigma regulatory factor (Ser/Thr protein kinase)
MVLLPHAPASVAAVRWQFSSDLRAAGVAAPAIGDAALVVSELLSNAILHARPLPGARVQVAWALTKGAVEVAVSDGGSATRPRPAQPSLSSIGGRGLAIVEYLSSRWGVRTNDLGTTVWAVMPAPGEDRARGAPGAGTANGHHRHAPANAFRQA